MYTKTDSKRAQVLPHGEGEGEGRAVWWCVQQSNTRLLFLFKILFNFLEN